MKKIYFWYLLILIIVALMPQGAKAQNRTQRETSTYVTSQQAMDIGYAFMRTGDGSKDNGTKSGAVRKQSMQLVYTGQATDSLTGTTTDCYYVFTLQPKGFVIVAADDRVEPILGYSYDNDFAVANMPDHVRGWLGNYEKQIEAVAKSDLQPTPETQTKWARLKSGQAMSSAKSGGSSVGPLLTTEWGQGWPYNAMCPEDHWGHALVGCVATAYAQVLNYWRHPSKGKGFHSYQHNNYGYIYADLEHTEYHWDNMPDVVTDYNPDVAVLNFHAGAVLDMDYGAFSSGAYTTEIPFASKQYFDYSQSITSVSFDGDLSHWDNLLRSQLQHLQPVIIGAYNSNHTLGHSYVIDGVENDYYHINFGWNGSSNGFYLIHPNSDVTMYQYGMSAIINMRPNKKICLFKATDVDSTSATLNASLDAGGDSFDSLRFVIWLNPQLPKEIIPSEVNTLSGNDVTMTKVVATGLRPNSTYKYCMLISNQNELFSSDTLEFQTAELTNLATFAPIIYNDTIYICNGTNWNGRTEGLYHDTTYFINSDAINYVINTNVIRNSTLPNVHISASQTEICQKDSILLVASGASHFTWNQNLIDKDSVWTSPCKTTTFKVTGELDGCVGQDSAIINVRQSYITTTQITVDSGAYWLPGNDLVTHSMIIDDTLQTTQGCDSIIRTILYVPHFSGGNGTAEIPYLIASKADMEELSVAVKGENNWSLNKYFLVTNDIYETVSTVVGHQSHPFMGHFDGNKKNIVLNIDMPDSSDVGMMAFVDSNAVVQNVIVDGFVRGDNNVGGICGNNFGGKLLFCTNKAKVTGQGESVGGICGGSLGGNMHSDEVVNKGFPAGVIEKCINTGEIHGNGLGVGGIAGDAVVSFCLNTGVVYNGHYWTGGIVGAGTANNSLNAGSVQGANWQTGTVTGYGSSDHCLNIGLCKVNYPTAHTVGLITGYGTTAFCFDDRQLSLFCSNNLYSNNTKFLNTIELIGEQQSNSLSTAFTYTSGLYPIPLGLDQDTIALLVATPVCFATNDTRLSIKSPFHVSNANGVVWSSLSGKVMFNNGTGTPLSLGQDTLMAQLGDNRKLIPINIDCIPTEDTLFLYGCQEVEYNGTLFTRDTIFNNSTTTQNENDSLFSVLIDIQWQIVDILDSIGENETYSFNGRQLHRHGIYYDTLTNVAGCDSIVRLNLRGQIFSGGDGSKENPYQITCREDMYELADSVVAHEEDWSADKHFRLMNDITDTLYREIPRFSGFFYGGGHRLNIHLEAAGEDIGTYGLFVTNGRVIDSLNIYGYIRVQSKCTRMGALVGSNDGTSRISNCNNYANVVGLHAAGISGWNANGAMVISCNNYGNITGRQSAGGICAENLGGFVEYCQNAGRIQAYSAGGIVAYEGTVMYCINIGEVFNMEGEEGDAGGISSGGTVIKACLNAGNVHKMNARYNVAGIGATSSNTVSNCLNIGQVSSKHPTLGKMDPLCAYSTQNQPFENSFFDKQRSPAFQYGDDRGKSTTLLLGAQTPMYGDATDCDNSVYERNETISEYYIDFNSFAAWLNCGWTIREGMYPCPTLSDKAYTDIAFVATSPVLFAESNTVDSVSKSFFVTTKYGVQWSSTVGNVLIDNSTGMVKLVSTGADTLIATLGNASMRIPLTIKSVPNSDTTIVLQDCDSVEYNNHIYTANRFIQECYTSHNNQDSVVNVVIRINKTINEICAYINPGEFYVFNTDTLWLSGIYFDTLVSSTGCDSILKLNLVVFGDIVYVRPDGNGNGTSWEYALSDINVASSIACHFSPKKQVWVSKGLYQPKDTIANSAFWINGGVVLLGGFVGNEASTYDVEKRDIFTNRSVLSGLNKMPVITLDDYVMMDGWPNNHFPVTIDGFYITEGYSAGEGGGVRFYGENSTVSKCVIYGNKAESGGGGVSGNGLVVGCVIDGNSAALGGGVHRSTIENSLILNNIASDAGGTSYSYITNCILWHNQPDQCQYSVVDYSCIENGYYGTENVDIAHDNDGTDSNYNYVRFLDPENGIYFLNQNSAAIDAGMEEISSLHVSDYDMALHDRIIGRRIDIGPFEQKCAYLRTHQDTVVLGLNDNYLFYNQEIHNSGTYYHLQRQDECDTMDVLEIIVIPSCEHPTMVRLDSVSTSSAVVHWEGDAPSYRIEYGEHGFILGEGIVNTSASNTMTLLNLTQNTQYDIYVTSVCDSLNMSEEAYLSLVTLPTCPQPINLYCAADSTIATVRWQEEGDATLWEYEYGPSGFTPGTGTMVVTHSMNNTISNLDANASYDIYVRSVCGSDDKSKWVKSSFTTKKRIYVTVTGGGLQNGMSWENAYSDLQVAIMEASLVGADVWVAEGTYSNNYGEEYVFSIPDNVTVYGGFAGDEPFDYDIRLRDYTAHTSVLDGNNVKPVVYCGGVLDGFTIQHGFSDNYAIGAAFTSSAYDFLGGEGGVLVNSIVKDNSSTFEYFGGIVGGTAINCLVFNNTNGGTCWSKLINSTIFNQGVYAGQSFNSILVGWVMDCIAHFSALPGATGNTSYYTQEIGNLPISDILLFNNELLFVDPENGDFRLTYGSACINAGMPDISALGLPSVDLQGLPRVLDGRIDMGAFEYYPVPVVEMYDTICEGSEIVFFDSVYNTEGRYVHHTSENVTLDTLYVLLLQVYPVCTLTGAPIRYVTQNGNGDGSSWANAMGDLQAAMDSAALVQGDVWVAQGSYLGDGTSENAFIVPDGVHVYGSFAGDEPEDYDLSLRNYAAHPTILDGQHTQRTVYHEWSWGAVPVLDGFIIQNGHSDYGGNVNGGNPRLVVNNSIIRDGHSDGEAGGLSNVTIHNSLIINNTASYWASAIKECDAYNCNLVGNIASENGYTTLWCSLTNCILWKNIGNPEYGSSTTYSAIEGQDVWGDGNILLAHNNDGISPDSNYVRFVDPGNSDFRLAYGSACINAGTPDTSALGLPSVDLQGLPRVLDGWIDMGAYEYYPVPVVEMYDTICEGYDVAFFDLMYNTEGRYVHHSSNDVTLDTLHVLYLTIYASDSVEIFEIACDAYEWNGEIYTESNTYVQTLTNRNDCDSVVTLHLTVNYGTHNVLDTTVCENFTWADGTGETYTISDTYIHAYINNDGCASVDTLHLTVNVPTEGDTTSVVCGSFDWHGYTNLTESGDYTDVLTNAAGCDSTVTLHLTVNTPTDGDTTAVVCGSFDWHGYTNLTESGDYTDVLTNAAGCDSTVTLHLTVNTPTEGDTTAIVCGSFNWHGYTNLTESGDYTDVLTNAAGCDSTVILHLTINNPAHTATTETVCGSYTWTTGTGTTYTESGTYLHSHEDTNGCIQVDTLHLTINNPVHTATTETACESYTWTAGTGTTYTESGTYLHSHEDANGCIQVDTLHLTINTPTAGDTTATVCGSFSWYEYSDLTQSGDYTHILTNAAGCDSIVTLHLTINQPVTTTSTATICDSELPYVWNGLAFNEAGTQNLTLQAVNGCDSTIEMTLTVNQSVPTDEYLVIYDNELPYHYVNGAIDTIFEIGTPSLSVFSFQFSTQDGCDSIIILHLTVETGINNHDMNASMKVYPNPTSNIVNVELSMNNGQSNNVAIQVYDMYGKLLDVVNVGNTDAMNRIPTGRSMDSYGEANTYGLSAQTTQIDLSSYANGVYFIKAVAEGNVVAIRKIVKNR